MPANCVQYTQFGYNVVTSSSEICIESADFQTQNTVPCRTVHAVIITVSIFAQNGFKDCRFEWFNKTNCILANRRPAVNQWEEDLP